jgi:hypothetical protein
MSLINWSLWNQLKAKKYDKAGGHIGTATEYTDFAINGFMSMVGAVAYGDMFLPIATGKLPASNFPAYTAYSAHLNAFTFAVGDYVDLVTQELPHCYKEGTDLEFHMHVITNGTEAVEKALKFEIYYVLGDMGGDMVAEATLTPTTDLIISADTPDRHHLYYSLGTVGGASLHIGNVLKLRVKRIASTGTAPASNPFVEMVGIHIMVDTLGSRQITIK